MASMGMNIVLLLSLLLSADPDDAKLMSIADAYQANRNSFVNVDCRFEVQFGKCATLEDALTGRLLETQFICDGRWLVRGPLVRYDFVRRSQLAPGDTQTVPRQRPTASTHGPYADDRYLINAGHILESGLAPGNVSFYGPNSHDGMGIRYHPFNTDIIGPHEYSNPQRYVEGCLTGRLTGQYDGLEFIGGVELEVVSIGLPGAVGKARMGFDPRRGHLLIYMEDSDPDTGRRRYAAYVTETQACPGGRWIPTRRINFHDPDADGPHRTEVLIVGQLNVDDAPPDEVFAMTLPAGMQVDLGRSDLERMPIKGERTVAATELPAMYDEFVKRGEELKRQKAKRRFFGGLQRMLRLPWSGTMWLTLSLVVAIVLLTVYWDRRSQSRIK